MSSPIRKLNRAVRFNENTPYLRPAPDSPGNRISGSANVEEKWRNAPFRSEKLRWMVAVDMVGKWPNGNWSSHMRKDIGSIISQ